jgi:hypothetical protein
MYLTDTASTPSRRLRAPGELGNSQLNRFDFASRLALPNDLGPLTQLASISYWI